MQTFTYTPPVGIPPIIYEDDDYLAINKPSGLLTNPGIAKHTHDCALTRIQKKYGPVFLVHRLDCDTSGILFFAKHKRAEGALKKMLQYRQVQKTYSALVWGIPAALSGVINQPLGPNLNNRPLQQVSKTGKESITQYTVLQPNPHQHFSLVELEPKTGRTHQLRVHMQHIGHPILGDIFYGHKECQSARSRLCLHAEKIEFIQPISQQLISIFEPAMFS